MLSVDDVEDFEKAMDIWVRDQDTDPDIRNLWDRYCRDYNYMRFGDDGDDE